MRNSTILGVGAFFLLVIAGIFAWNVLTAPQRSERMDDVTPQYGIGGGPGVDLNSPSAGSNQTTIDESIGLNGLFQEHAIAASFHLQDLYDGKDTSESSGRLQNNSVKIADFFQQKTGADKNSFLSMWDGHIREYENYTTALKNNDRNGTDEARDNLNDHAVMMGEAINRTYPNISAQEVTNLMNEHIDLTLSVIEAHAAGNTTEKLTKSTQASTQAVNFADRIVDTIEGDTED